VDPKVIKRAALTSAIAAYEIANADVRSAAFMAGEVFARSQFRLQRLGSDTLHYINSLSGGQLNEEAKKKVGYALNELDHFAERDSKGLGTLQGLVGEEANADFEALIEGYQARLKEEAKEQRIRIEQAQSWITQV
jgi:hypothetical protein